MIYIAFNLSYIYVCMCVGCVPLLTCGGQRTTYMNYYLISLYHVDPGLSSDNQA